MEVSNLSFRVMIIRILNSRKEEIETRKQDQSIKNAISEINNTLGGIG